MIGTLNGPIPGVTTADGTRRGAPGELTYNGVGLGSLHKLRKFAVPPEKDQAGRTIVYNRVSLAFEWHVQFDPRAAVGRSQNYVEYLQRALTKPAGHFRWDRRGVGLLEVNRPGNAGMRDAVYGPWPTISSLELLAASAADVTGGDRATWKVMWELEICMPQCADARYTLAPMEYGYEVSYRIEKGLTTRTVTGFVRVPATRTGVGDRTIPDSADRYREDVVPARLVGYRRTYDSGFKLDYSKQKLEFAVVDAQLPGPPPPPGVLEWDASESLSTSGLAMKSWTGTIEAQYEAAPDADPEQMQRHFLSLAADRVAALKKSKGVDKKGTGVLVTGLRVANPSLAGVGRFTASLGFKLTATNLTDFLAGHGLWRPLPNTGGWAAWDKSMGAVFSPRGISGLYFAPATNDAIVDLCGDLPRLGDQPASPPQSPQTNLLRGGVFAPPQASESWLRYLAWVEVEVDGGTNTLRTLPAAPLDSTLRGGPGVGTSSETQTLLSTVGNPSSGDGLRVAGQLLNETAPPTPTQPPAVTVSQRVTPIVTRWLTVRANRVRYPVPCPALYDKTGKALLPDLRSGETCWVQAEAGDLMDDPVYGAWARIRYTLPSDVAATVSLDDLILYNPMHHSG